MYNNKKGIGIDDALPLIIFIFVAASVVVLFSIIENSKSNKIIDDIQRQKDFLEGHEVLMEYITKLDAEGNNKADLILKSYVEKDYRNLKNDMEEYFGSKLSHLSDWSIEVFDPYQNKIFSLQRSGFYSGYEQVQFTKASLLIPAKSSETGYIKINLFLGTVI